MTTTTAMAITACTVFILASCCFLRRFRPIVGCLYPYSASRSGEG
jgi:hypothetical protein